MNEEGLKKFADTIKKKNINQQKWMRILFICLLFLAFFISMENDIVITKNIYVRCIIVIFFDIEFTLSFYKRYLQFEKNRTPFGLWLIMGNHAFDFECYFSYITRKMIPYKAIILLVYLVYGIYTTDIYVIAVGIIGAVMSVAVGWLYKKRVYNKMQTVKRFSLIETILEGILEYSKLLLSYLVIITMFFLLFAVVSDLILPKLNDAQVIYRAAYADVFSYYILMCLVLWIVYLAAREKRMIIICRCLVVAVFVVFLWGIYDVRQNNTVINLTEQSITVSNGEAKEYSFSDIEKLTPIYGDDIQIEIELKDGTVVYGFGRIDSQSEAFIKKYGDDNEGFVRDILDAAHMPQ